MPGGALINPAYADKSAPASAGQSPLFPPGDPATECLTGVPLGCAVGALAACALLALLLLLLGVSRYAFLVIWCIGTPFAAALGGGLSVYARIRRPPSAP